jgi:Cytochrome P460
MVYPKPNDRLGFMSPSAVILVAGSMMCLMAQPNYTTDGQVNLPADYREWVFLSSGLGMTYQPMKDDGPAFTNVFVNPAAYRSFVSTGKWPDKTMLVLEVRASASKGSINKGGSYQSDLLGIEGEVKDTTRFPGSGWAFFAFGKSKVGKMLPRTEACYACHAEHAAVDNTFVQFYPALVEIAKQKGTYQAGR